VLAVYFFLQERCGVGGFQPRLISPLVFLGFAVGRLGSPFSATPPRAAERVSLSPVSRVLPCEGVARRMTDDAGLLDLVNGLAPRLAIAADDDAVPLCKRLRVQDSDGESLPSPREHELVEPEKERITLEPVTLEPRSVTIESGSDAEPETDKSAVVGLGPKRWRVGTSSGLWIHARHAPLEAQSQVLLANVVANLSKLTLAQTRQVYGMLRPLATTLTRRIHASWLFRLCHVVLAVPLDYIDDQT
jgi:hypothetical protein